MRGLERELQKTDFAILVASADDQLIKREVTSKTMRDNLLIEFGLFTGALGRKRSFFLCPDEPRLDLPSDLLGIQTATYDSNRAARGGAELAASIETPCQNVLIAIALEWERKQHADTLAAEHLRTSDRVKAIKRLETAATSIRDALIALQRDAFAALTDKSAFADAKRKATAEIDDIAQVLRTDAELINACAQLEMLRDRTDAAIADLPFPEELAAPALERSTEDLGVAALTSFLSGRDAMRELQHAAVDETGTILSALCTRYSKWWDAHSPRLQEATAQLQNALFDALLQSVNV